LLAFVFVRQNPAYQSFSLALLRKITQKLPFGTLSPYHGTAVVVRPREARQQNEQQQSNDVCDVSPLASTAVSLCDKK
jgi:hypothetical protein